MTHTNRKIPNHYEIRAIAEHAMRRLFQASGRSWEEYGPEDAQRCEWLEQALVMETEAAEALNAERTDWNIPRTTTLRAVPATPPAKAIRAAQSERLADRILEEAAQ